MTGEGARASGIAHLIATGFYSGYAPVAPGTFGTLVGVVIAPVFAGIAAASALAYLLALGLAIACAIWAAEVATRIFELKDPRQVVCDEIVGYLIAMAFLPVGWGSLLYAFLFFRFFDITKPAPCRQAEALPGGYGVVVDDLAAGVYANLAVRVVLALGAPVF